MLVGCFPNRLKAHEAVHALDVAQLPPQSVSLIADDREIAAEIGGHSFQTWGALIGLVLGFALATFAVSLGGPRFRTDPFAIALGAVFVPGGLAFLGLVCGGAILRRGPDARLYERVVAGGGAIVLITPLSEELRVRAHAILESSGAQSIVDEGFENPHATKAGRGLPAS